MADNTGLRLFGFEIKRAKDKSAEKRLGNDQKHDNRKKRNNKRPKNKQQESKTKKSGGRYTKDLPESLRAKFMFPLE